MKTMSKIRQANLKILKEGFKNQRAFADAIDATPGYVSQLLIGACPFGEKAARKIELQLNKPVKWLDEDRIVEDSMTAQERPAPDQQKTNNLKPIEGSNVERIEKNYGKVPLISWVTAGSWCEAHDPYPSGYAEDWMDCPISHSTGTYALTVVGDSMTSPHAGTESYTQGMIIFCDPALEPRSGDKVIAKLVESNEVTFKVYRVDGGKSWLMPLNPLYDKIEITEGMHICGVVIFAGFNTRR